MTAGSQPLGGSPTDRCESSAPVKSNTRPANAHSLSLRNDGTDRDDAKRLGCAKEWQEIDGIAEMPDYGHRLRGFSRDPGWTPAA